jgi:hypothetical protein
MSDLKLFRISIDLRKYGTYGTIIHDQHEKYMWLDEQQHKILLKVIFHANDHFQLYAEVIMPEKDVADVSTHLCIVSFRSAEYDNLKPLGKSVYFYGSRELVAEYIKNKFDSKFGPSVTIRKEVTISSADDEFWKAIYSNSIELDKKLGHPNPHTEEIDKLNNELESLKRKSYEFQRDKNKLKDEFVEEFVKKIKT